MGKFFTKMVSGITGNTGGIKFSVLNQIVNSLNGDTYFISSQEDTYGVITLWFENPYMLDGSEILGNWVLTPVFGGTLSRTEFKGITIIDPPPAATNPSVGVPGTNGPPVPQTPVGHIYTVPTNGPATASLPSIGPGGKTYSFNISFPRGGNGGSSLPKVQQTGCNCGASKVNSSNHSSWCDLEEKAVST